MKKIFLTGIIVLLFMACSHEKTIKFSNYDITDITDSAEIKLSDLLEQIRIVPLQTDTSFLVNRENIAVSDKYIVSFGKKEVHQFDAISGRHIRKLAENGRGPNEYNHFSSAIIDDVKDILYFSHQGAKNILCINLQTGEFLPSIEQPKRGVDLMLISPQGNICTHDDSLMFSVLDVKTGVYSRMIDSAVSPVKSAAMKLPFSVGTMMGGISLLGNHDEVFLYSQKFNDTMYRYYSPNRIEKAFSITHKDKFVENKGIFFSISYICDGNILCMTHNAEFLKDEQGDIIGISAAIGNMVSINRNDNSIKIVNKFMCDFNSLNLALPLYLSSYSGTYISPTIFAQTCDAYKVKTAIELALEKNELPDNDKKYLMDLDSQLSEESNPVVIIGKRRK